MFAVLMPRKVNFMAKQGLFDKPVMGWVLRSANAFPVDRDSRSPKSMKRALELLDRGEAVALFPEGTRAPAPGLQRGLPGITYLALKSQAPILPVGITGTADLHGWWRIPAPFRRIRVRIGPAFTLPNVEGRLPREVLAQLTDMLMQRIADQLPPEYQGVYRRDAAPQDRREPASPEHD